MLKSLKQKICPLLTLTLAFGCGKKATESSDAGGQTSQNQNLSTTTEIFKLASLEGARKIFSVPRNGIFKIPSKLYVEKGNGRGKSISLTYSLDPRDSTIFEFRCTYKNTVSQPDQIPLEKCTDDLNRDLGDMSIQQSPMYKDEIIEMKLITPTNEDFEVHAWHEVEWK